MVKHSFHTDNKKQNLEYFSIIEITAMMSCELRLVLDNLYRDMKCFYITLQIMTDVPETFELMQNYHNLLNNLNDCDQKFVGVSNWGGLQINL